MGKLMAVLVATINAGGANPTQLTLAQDHFTLVAPQSQTIVPTGGMAQTTNVNTPFTNELQVTVTRVNGVPVAGVEVTLQQRQVAAVASPSSSGTKAITNAQGQATIVVFGGATPGSVKDRNYASSRGQCCV